MITKAECISVLDVKIPKALSGELYIAMVPFERNESDISEALKNSKSSEEVYFKIGDLFYDADSRFENICYREDCYDYLRDKGLDESEARKLMEVIRKGQYRFKKYQITSEKLTDEFYAWAKGVKYLPSRRMLKDMFDTTNVFKLSIVESFDKYYYKKLRRSLPGKITSGEIEWIYSYGDKLIARGHKAVFEVVKQIVESKNCDNNYIEPNALYAKCKELYDKYKNKIFWFRWF